MGDYTRVTLHNFDVEMDSSVPAAYCDFDDLEIEVEGYNVRYRGSVNVNGDATATVEIDLVNDFVWSEQRLEAVAEAAGLGCGHLIGDGREEASIARIVDTSSDCKPILRAMLKRWSTFDVLTGFAEVIDG